VFIVIPDSVWIVTDLCLEFCYVAGAPAVMKSRIKAAFVVYWALKEDLRGLSDFDDMNEENLLPLY
jgi:hypothetical protein